MTAEAVDGRRGILVSWQDEHLLPNDAGECLVSEEIALAADKSIPKNDPNNAVAQLSFDAGSRQLEVRVPSARGDTKWTSDVPVDAFPEVRQMLSTAKPAACCSLGLELLIELLQAIKATGADTVRINVPASAAQAIRFEGLNAPWKVEGVQMQLADR